MYKFILIATTAAALVCVAHAGISPTAHAEILKHDSQLNVDGSYKVDYSTSNGIAVQEDGFGGHHASGGFSYYSPEGELIQLSYLADENGFKPQGNHLPTPPPIPPQILKSLEYIRLHPYDEESAHRQHHQQQQQQQQYRPQPQAHPRHQQFQHVAASSHQVKSLQRPTQRRHF
ncbi:pupal cuticle protein Edg-78E-like [Ceratitis capitata]|uniref:pupal cuticle protein Edg-78E-like n=1 Tax=Ceratitis capitata TaxID=7213 RepID=UPI00032A3ADB|nr:pupal cuticle protein Edg-78E-like [Ceratitis capitata]